jgi:hypothetical protein
MKNQYLLSSNPLKFNFKSMKKFLLLFFVLSFTLLMFHSQGYAGPGNTPKTGFEELLVQAEENPENLIKIKELSLALNQPVSIITKDRRMIDAKGIEDGKIIYAVINDLLNPFNNGQVLFYDQVESSFNLNESKLVYTDGKIIDNTNGMYSPVIGNRSGVQEFLMITDWTYDRVSLFDALTGDMVDTAFIYHSNPQLQSPKQAIQTYYKTQILVADQISDAVQRYDTNGLYVGIFAPAGGVNPAIIDNMRGIAYKPDNHLLATVASGVSANTIQEFDTAGVHVGTFISSISSPFCILYRSSDILITSSSGTNRISKFDFSGAYISSFYTGSDFAFPQQAIELENGYVIVAAFSPAASSGVVVLDSAGNFIRRMNALTGIRGVYLLGNGNYLVTNSTGVHEIDSLSGALIRTVVTGANFQYIDKYVPDKVLNIGNNTLNSLDYKLYENFPNPFNPSTVIRFSISKSENVMLNVYDVSGRKIKTLLNEVRSPGIHGVTFNAEGLPSGIYFYEIEAGNYKESRKMILLK